MIAATEQDAPGATPFVWPPAPLAAEPIDTDAPDDAPPEPGPAPPAGIGVRAETDLLGLRAVSFARWARATGWRPDCYGDFCWRCAGSVGPHETDGSGCGSCRDKSLAWDRAARLGLYEGGVRAAVTDLKFGRWRRTGTELGEAMGERLADLLGAGGFEPGEAAIVPVPASWRRRMARGVDHTTVLARAAGRRAGVPVVRGLSRRHSPPQVGLSATARAANMRGVFKAEPRLGRGLAKHPGLRVIVVLDDVRTTGATMTAACRAVRKVAGRKREIWALTAVVASDRRPDRGDPGGVAPRGPARTGGSRGGRGPGHEKFEKTFGVAV